MLKFLKQDLKATIAAITTETDVVAKLTTERTAREGIKKAKVAAQAKEKEFSDADGYQKKLREGKRKAESELKNLAAQLKKFEKSGT